MADYYEDNHETYHEVTFSVDPTPVLEPLQARLAPGSRVLDVGCGSGRDMAWFAARGHHCTGVERSPGLARLAREHTGCPVIQDDMRVVDFAGLASDAVLAIGTLVHLPRVEMPGMLSRISASLGGDGHLLVSMKEGRGSVVRADGRVNVLWTDAGLRVVFSSLGFHVADFSRRTSLVNPADTWIAYVLRARGAVRPW
ncbi:MAG: class I SAM-dependent methyltransferase [Desulfatibacillaceae bacterium]